MDSFSPIDGLPDWASSILKEVQTRNEVQSSCYTLLFKAYEELIQENRKLQISASRHLLDEREAYRQHEFSVGSIREPGEAGAPRESSTIEDAEALRAALAERNKAFHGLKSERDCLETLLKERDDEVAEKDKELLRLRINSEYLLHEQLTLKQTIDELKSQVLEKAEENDEIVGSLMRFKNSEVTRLRDLQDLYRSLIQEQDPSALDYLASTNRDTDGGAEISQRHESGSVVEEGEVASPADTCSRYPLAVEQHCKAQRTVLEVHDGPVMCLVACNSDDFIYSGGVDGQVSVVNSLTLAVEERFSPAASSSGIVCMDSWFQTLLLACEDLSLNLLDIKTQRITASLKGHANKITCCGFIITDDMQVSEGHAPPTRLVSASLDRTIRLWNSRKCCCVRTAHVLSGITGGCICKKTNTLAVCHQNGSVGFWSIHESGIEQKGELSRIHECLVTGVSFSSGGEYVVSQSKDHSLKLIDAQDYRVLASFTHESFRSTAMSVAIPRFSPDSKYLCSFIHDVVWTWALEDTQLGHALTHVWREHVNPVERPRNSDITYILWNSKCGIVTSHKNGSICLGGSDRALYDHSAYFL